MIFGKHQTELFCKNSYHLLTIDYFCKKFSRRCWTNFWICFWDWGLLLYFWHIREFIRLGIVFGLSINNFNSKYLVNDISQYHPCTSHFIIIVTLSNSLFSHFVILATLSNNLLWHFVIIILKFVNLSLFVTFCHNFFQKVQESLCEVFLSQFLIKTVIAKNLNSIQNFTVYALQNCEERRGALFINM